MFGAGRDDWDSGERLFAGDRGDLSGPGFDFGAGFGPDRGDPWHHEPLAIGREVAVSFPASVTLAVGDDA